MKNLTKRLLMAFVLFSLALVLSNCDDEEAVVDLPDKEVEFLDIALTGEAEVQTPAVVTDGTGKLNAVYNENTKKITYTISWKLGNESDKTVGMHFHGPATPSENAAIIIGIPLTQNSGGGYTDPGSESEGSVSGQTRALTQEEEDQLLNGMWYLNIHSTTYPSGELRGQVK